MQQESGKTTLGDLKGTPGAQPSEAGVEAAKHLSTVQQAKATVKDMLTRAMPAIQQALPKHMTADVMVRVAITALTTTPKLLECYPPTFVGAVIQSAQLGLEPNTPQGLAYFVPFWNTKKNRLECQLIPGYRGLVKLARQSGEITTIEARVVYAKDRLDLVLGTEQRLNHVPMIDDDPGERRLAYAIARLKGGESDPIIEIMTKKQIEGIKARSKSKDKQGEVFGPWKTDEDEMWRKTVVRRICKYLPASRELALALALDDRGGQHSQHLETVLDHGALHLPDIEASDDSPEARAANGGAQGAQQQGGQEK